MFCQTLWLIICSELFVFVISYLLYDVQYAENQTFNAFLLNILNQS